MKRISSISILLFSLILLACSDSKEDNEVISEQTESLLIEGVISNANNANYYLFEYSGEAPSKLDSAIVDGDGNFSFSLSPKGYSFYGIGKDINEVVALLLKGDEKVKITGDAKDLMFGCTITGSTDTKIMTDFSKKHKTFFDAMQVLKDSMQVLDYGDNAGRDVIIAQANTLKVEFDKYKYEFINNNTESPAIYMAASELYDIIGELEYLEKIEKVLAEKMAGSAYHNVVAQKINQAQQTKLAQEQQIKMIEQQQMAMAASGIAIGKEAPDLNFPNPNGKNISLKSLKGKIVLLDFWASWCKPCRMENPNVVRLYKEYKSKGFTIYSFSLDNNVDRWKTAINQDGLVWPNHTSDLKGWQSAGSALYKVNSIPQTFLIDKDGKIIDIGLRGVQLEEKLKQLLG